MMPSHRSVFLVACAAAVLAGCGRHEAPVPSAGGAVDQLVQAEPWTTGPVAATEGAHCALDAINGTPAAGTRVARGEKATFYGWAAAPGPVPAPTGSKLVLEGEAGAWALPLPSNVTRDDVAGVFGVPALSTSGYNLDAATATLPPGRYAVKIAFAGEPATGCDTQQALVLE